jgi:hypothetical protein
MRKLLLIAGVAAIAIPCAAWSHLATPAAEIMVRDAAYDGPADDLSARERWIEQRIHEGDAEGALSRGDAEHDFDVLAGIRAFEARQADRHDGLTGEDRADVLNKLDNLSAIVRSQWED